MSTTTTAANYDETLTRAMDLLDERMGDDTHPAGEREKAISDALNNVWVEGMTVAVWVELAAKRLHV